MTKNELLAMLFSENWMEFYLKIRPKSGMSEIREREMKKGWKNWSLKQITFLHPKQEDIHAIENGHQKIIGHGPGLKVFSLPGETDPKTTFFLLTQTHYKSKQIWIDTTD